jgi:lysozyme family protein
MENKFDKAFQYILLVEGGYSDNKADGGGKTMYGITEIVARKYGYKGEMSKMSKAIAADIYKKKYWDKNQLGRIDDFRVALSIFDWTVNSGTWGTKKAQTAVNKTLGDEVLKVDGIIGNNSIKYINEVDPDKFLSVYHFLQIAFYQSIAKGSQKIFLKGWLNRVDRKEKFIKNL